ncbi:MAG TPA: NADH-quinone oxidoreductase subunit A [Sphingopyxis sp.]|uniref:NADH-quinone oxidoreductase subunit A n=1 Tax=Sphingopyxis sp. TaxID=1908224 RepID=UPI002C14A050|nr:NADH-quinone oxidoreductase subunit A [Sphingopyxis sp.]HWW59056.1 NADH-quinone oxidoreductase subunit A [Sphingopyxis sp.]
MSDIPKPGAGTPAHVPFDLTEYLPVLIFLGVALAISLLFVFLPMAISRLTGTHAPETEKLTEYECGFPAFEAPRSRFDVRFYLVAILFIIFDLEAAFLWPWAVVVTDLGWEAWGAMMIFLSILTVGFIYEWKKGALDWE